MKYITDVSNSLDWHIKITAGNKNADKTECAQRQTVNSVSLANKERRVTLAS
jgi:hypothetical protein